jgi:putative NADPH-quinone reductase
MDDGFSRLFPLLEQAEILVFCSPLYWYSVSGHLKCAMDRMYPYFQKGRPRSLKVQETMLLMCGQTRLLRSFAGAAESYRQAIGYAGWRDRGRLFATGVDGLAAIAGSSALAEAEAMGRGA